MLEPAVDREKLRRACWRMLEPDLGKFWEDYRSRSGYDRYDSTGKFIAISGAQAVIDMVISFRQGEIANLSNPDHTKAEAVLQECRVLCDEFFERLRMSVSH